MEKVYVENDWYDGPRSGIADFDGSPHRFIANYENLKGYLDTFNVFPVSNEELELEIEQWKIFVKWNQKYEAGEVETDSHPGNGGLNQRWDELETLLSRKRKTISNSALKLAAKFESNEQDNRYEITGPDYGVIWSKINENT